MPARTRPPKWLKDAVFYQIYPQSFADSNQDGIGDLPGIISKLDYLRDLGVNALWLNPIFPSAFGDAGYDVTDFYGVAARYGTLEDARALFSEAHARGIRVILDLVAGHTSDQHPWFRASASAKTTPFDDWYIWTHSVWDGFKVPGTINGFGARDGAYLPNFFHFQPALNYGYARPDPLQPWQQAVSAPGPRAVRQELRRIMEHWLRLGVDGFRVDMASSLVKADRTGRAMRDLWSEFRGWLDRDWPEAILVSEWSNPREAIRAGFHIDFLIHFNAPAYTALCAPRLDPALSPKDAYGWCDAANRGDVKAFIKSYVEQYRATHQRGYIAMPSGNHDFARFRYGRSEAELRVFFALLLTLPGVPFIYYGDEIGLDFHPGLPSKEGGYGRTGTRTPMQWDDSINRGFSTAPAEQLYLPVDKVAGRCVAAQEAAPDSMLQHVRQLLKLRREQPSSLGNSAAFRPLHARRGHPVLVFARGRGANEVIVCINPTREAGSVPFQTAESLVPLTEGGARAQRNCLQVPGFSYGIWKVDDGARSSRPRAAENKPDVVGSSRR